MNLTSRKLAAAIAGLIAIVTIYGFAVFGTTALPTGEFDKVILAISTITLSAIGAQAFIDSKNGNGTSHDPNKPA